MKAIITRKVGDTFPEVGTSDRFVTSAATLAAIRRRAAKYANGQEFRVELFLSDSIYGEPDEIRFYPAGYRALGAR